MAGTGWTARLLRGMAEHLANVGAGVWRPTGIYQAGEVGILIRAVPPSPDQIITLSPYLVPSQPGTSDVLQGVQVRVRGTTNPDVCADIGDAVYEAIDSLQHVSWGGVHVNHVWRVSYTSLGSDNNGRWEASHNYYLRAMRPGINRDD